MQNLKLQTSKYPKYIFQYLRKGNQKPTDLFVSLFSDKVFHYVCQLIDKMLVRLIEE